MKQSQIAAGLIVGLSIAGGTLALTGMSSQSSQNQLFQMMEIATQPPEKAETTPHAGGKMCSGACEKHGHVCKESEHKCSPNGCPSKAMKDGACTMDEHGHEQIDVHSDPASKDKPAK